ncbi:MULTISPECIES: hypothetical protein [Salinibaculum]|uniref:hypothetical protein n=1 Tax=Salinibaculum TaxID=2732368 RepID=UPI0030D2A313
MPTAYLVGLPVHAGEADELREGVVSRAQADADRGMQALLPHDGVLTVTVCLGRGRDGPRLWWFVEIADDVTSTFQDPAGAIRESPLLAGNASKLLEAATPLVFGPGGQDGPLMVHATNPDRPRGYVRSADTREGDGEGRDSEQAADRRAKGTPQVLVADEGPAAVPEVYLVTWGLRGGPATWFMRALTRLMRLTRDTRIERQFEEWSRPVIEDEQMWTETGFYDRAERASDDRDRIRYWMECDSLEGVWQGFDESTNLVARVSEVVLGWVIDRPERALSVEGFTTDCETLVHAVAPER